MLYAYTDENLSKVKELGLDGVLLPPYNLYSRLSDNWRIIEDYYLSCVIDKVNDEELQEFFKGVLVRIKYLSLNICRGVTEGKKDYVERVVYANYELGELENRVKSLKDVAGIGEEEYNKGWGYIAITDVADEDGKELVDGVYGTWKGELYSIVRGVSPDVVWYRQVKDEFMLALNNSLNAFRYLCTSKSFTERGKMLVEDRAELIKRLDEIDDLLLDVLVSEVGKDGLKKEVSAQRIIGGSWSLFK